MDSNKEARFYAEHELLPHGNMPGIIDALKKKSLSNGCRSNLLHGLDNRLLSARGRLRSELHGITYSDYLNLLSHATSRSLSTGNFKSLAWKEVEEELQSIVKKYESSLKDASYKQGNSDLIHSHVSESLREPISQAKARRLVIHTADNSSFEQGAYGPFRYNWGQHFGGMINNQIVYDAGNGDVPESLWKPKTEAKARPLGIPTADNSSVEKGACGTFCNNGEQHFRGMINNQIGYIAGNGNGSCYVFNGCKILRY